jgi:hypothetical protein
MTPEELEAYVETVRQRKANKKNVQSMTPEELEAYVETVRQRNAANAKKYYETKIKTDPEIY